MEDVSVIKKAAEMNAEHLLAHFDRIADAPDAIPRLRRFILDLAVRSKLVPQDPNDEPASELLKRIAAGKARLVKAGEIKKPKELPKLGQLPFSIPNSWQWLPLGELGFTQTGTTPPKSRPDYYGDEIPFIKPGDLHPKCVDYSNDGLSQIGIDSCGRQAPANSILMVCIGTIGKCQLIDRICSFNQQINSISPYGETSSTFLLGALQSSYFQNMAWMASARTTIAILNKSNWTELPIPLPPLAEQHRIVAKVDELMTLCDRLEAARVEREATRDRMATATLARLNTPDPDPATFQNHAAFALNNLTPLTTRPDQIKALRQTILNLAVRGKLVPQDPNDEPASELLKRIAIERNALVEQKTIRRTPVAAIDEGEPPFEVPHRWEWSRIGDAVLFTQYGTSTKSSPSAPGVPVLTMGNIHAGMVVWGNEKTIPYTAEEFPALYLKQFDLLYNRTNSAELVGKTGIYLGEDDCRTFASYLIRVRVSREHFSPHFLNLTMNTPEFRETQIIPLIKKQTGQANVNGTALKHMLVPVPPLAEQHRIITKVDALMALCDQLETSLITGNATRRHLLDALLHEALGPDENCRESVD